MSFDSTSHPQYGTIVAVAAAVMAAERDTDQSIKALSGLIATTLDEFADAQLPASSAQRALDKLVLAIGSQVEGRRKLGEAHREYGRVAKALGATADGWGPGWPCYTVEGAAKRTRTPLRRVA